MPRGDRTGPMGMGPMTGRGGGYCTGSGRPAFNQGGWGSFFSNGPGLGSGWGGGGRGLCRWFFGAGLPAWRRFAGGGASVRRIGSGFGKTVAERPGGSLAVRVGQDQKTHSGNGIPPRLRVNPLQKAARLPVGRQAAFINFPWRPERPGSRQAEPLREPSAGHSLAGRRFDLTPMARTSAV